MTDLLQPQSTMPPTGVAVRQQGNSLVVTCPWNPEFIAEARRLRGKWDAASRAWVFREVQLHSQVRALLSEIFCTDGTQTPVLDVLLHVHQFLAASSPAELIELGGRRVLSVHPDSTKYQLDASVSVVHGEVHVRDGFLACSRDLVLEIACLPEPVLDTLPEAQRGSIRILVRHGLDMASLLQQEANLAEQLGEVRQLIQNEQTANHGLLAPVNNPSTTSLAWRLRCRTAADGTERKNIHLDGCTTPVSSRRLTDSEVLDLVTRGATACKRCGAHGAVSGISSSSIRLLQAQGGPTAHG